MGRYISLFTDFGFKRVFGEEPNKDLLIDFLNELLTVELKETAGDPIKDLTFLRNENLGNTPVDRKAVFDLYCETVSGKKIIVELQKAKQNFFKDRSVFYATFPIQQQALQGDWNFELKAVYTIGILDFVFDEDRNEPEKIVYKEDKYLHNVKLVEIETQQVFYEKLSFIYLEMPKFKKDIDELETHFEKWLYLFKNLSNLTERPAKLQERVFEKLFTVSEIGAFSSDERQAYERSLKYYRDLNNVVDTARMEGKEEGFIEGRAEGRVQGHAEGRAEGLQEGQRKIALEMKKAGLPSAEIERFTGLSAEEIEKLR